MKRYAYCSLQMMRSITESRLLYLGVLCVSYLLQELIFLYDWWQIVQSPRCSISPYSVKKRWFSSFFNGTASCTVRRSSWQTIQTVSPLLIRDVQGEDAKRPHIQNRMCVVSLLVQCDPVFDSLKWLIRKGYVIFYDMQVGRNWVISLG